MHLSGHKYQALIRVNFEISQVKFKQTKVKSLATDFNQENWMLVIRLMILKVLQLRKF